MGKAGKWFRSLLASVKSPEKDRKSSNKRCLLTSGDDSGTPYVDGIDANKHAIAVAAATAAVEEAALAASKAAAEVVRLTGGGRAASGDRRATVAAVKIQSAFRAYLAKRALRALKGLVKLQALVRGHIVRKQSADMLRRMQAMARIQARASAHRSYLPHAKTIFSNSHHPVRGITSPRIYNERSNSVVNGGSLLKPRHLRSGSDISSSKENSEIASRWLNQWMEQCAWDKSLHKTSLDEQSDKILEIDTWKPHPNNKTRNDQTAPVSRPSSKHHKPSPSISSEDVDRVPTRMAHNSPRVHSSFTPTTSECSRSGFGDYIGGCHRSYMANTESSRAKVRSHSAPKQRMQLERLGQSVNFGFWEYSDTFSERGSFIPANIRDGTYRYSGQVKRQGTPARDPGVGISSVYGHRMNV